MADNQPSSFLHRGFCQFVVGCLGILPRRTQSFVWMMFQPLGELDGPVRGIKMYVRSRYERWRQKSCAKEPETVAWLQKNLRDDDVLYDVGSNVGAYTLFACGFNPGVRVVCVEPVVANVNALSSNLLVNGFDKRVWVLNCALTGTREVTRFEIKNNIAGTASSHSCPGNDLSQAVLCMPLDELPLLGLPHPTIMKIDIDGGELDMLSGACETLRNPQLRTVLIEADNDGTVEAVIEIVEKLGLKLADKHERSGSLANLVFVREA